MKEVSVVMPIYAYRCTDCNNEFDEFSFEPQSAEDMSSPCPECGSQDTERIISSVRVHAPARRGTGEIQNAEEEAARQQVRGRQALDQRLRNRNQ